MAWYKVWLVVPGTDGDGESGPCTPQWWNDMVQTDSEEDAVAVADAKARADWETPCEGFPSAKEVGCECPVCTGAQTVTDEEHAAWVKEMEELEPPPYM